MKAREVGVGQIKYATDRRPVRNGVVSPDEATSGLYASLRRYREQRKHVQADSRACMSEGADHA